MIVKVQIIAAGECARAERAAAEGAVMCSLRLRTQAV